MAKPATVPTWATGTNYAGGPDIGTPTKVAPSGGRIADGWRRDDVPPAQEQNYFQNGVGQWITWLNGLALTDVSIGVQLSISGTSHILGSFALLVDSTASLIVSSGGLLGVSAGATLGVSGTVNVDAAGQLVVKNTALLVVQAGGTFQMDGTGLFGGQLTPTGAGHVNHRRIIGATTNHTYTIADADLIAANPTAGSIAYKLDSTGVGGISPQITVSVVGASNTTNTIDVQDQSGVSLLLGLTMRNAGTDIKWADFMFNPATGLYNMVRYGL